MILVLCGTQKQSFKRMVDEVLKLQDVEEEIIIQKGHTPFESDTVESFDFIPFDELMNLYDRADVIVTHAGAGSLIEGIKKEKRIIAFPRLKEYGEHLNDHQIELANKFSEDSYLISYNEGDDIHELYDRIKSIDLKPWDYKGNIVNLIEDYVDNHQQSFYEKVMMALVSHKFLRFAFTGVLNTIVDLTLFYLLIQSGTYYMVAKVISFLSAVVFSYLVNSFWTYKVKLSWKKFLLFPLSTLPNMLMQLVSLYVFVEFLGLSKMLSSGIAILIAIPISFFVSRFILEK